MLDDFIFNTQYYIIGGYKTKIINFNKQIRRANAIDVIHQLETLPTIQLQNLEMQGRQPRYNNRNWVSREWNSYYSRRNCQRRSHLDDVWEPNYDDDDTSWNNNSRYTDFDGYNSNYTDFSQTNFNPPQYYYDVTPYNSWNNAKYMGVDQKGCGKSSNKYRTQNNIVIAATKNKPVDLVTTSTVSNVEETKSISKTSDGAEPFNDTIADKLQELYGDDLNNGLKQPSGVDENTKKSTPSEKTNSDIHSTYSPSATTTKNLDDDWCPNSDNPNSEISGKTTPKTVLHRTYNNINVNLIKTNATFLKETSYQSTKIGDNKSNDAKHQETSCKNYSTSQNNNLDNTKKDQPHTVNTNVQLNYEKNLNKQNSNIQNTTSNSPTVEKGEIRIDSDQPKKILETEMIIDNRNSINRNSSKEAQLEKLANTPQKRKAEDTDGEINDNQKIILLSKDHSTSKQARGTPSKIERRRNSYCLPIANDSYLFSKKVSISPKTHSALPVSDASSETRSHKLADGEMNDNKKILLLSKGHENALNNINLVSTSKQIMGTPSKIARRRNSYCLPIANDSHLFSKKVSISPKTHSAVPVSDAPSEIRSHKLTDGEINDNKKTLVLSNDHENAFKNNLISTNKQTMGTPSKIRGRRDSYSLPIANDSHLFNKKVSISPKTHSALPVSDTPSETRSHKLTDGEINDNKKILLLRKDHENALENINPVSTNKQTMGTPSKIRGRRDSYSLRIANDSHLFSKEVSSSPKTHSALPVLDAPAESRSHKLKNSRNSLSQIKAIDSVSNSAETKSTTIVESPKLLNITVGSTTLTPARLQERRKSCLSLTNSSPSSLQLTKEPIIQLSHLFKVSSPNESNNISVTENSTEETTKPRTNRGRPSNTNRSVSFAKVKEKKVQSTTTRCNVSSSQSSNNKIHSVSAEKPHSKLIESQMSIRLEDIFNDKQIKLPTLSQAISSTTHSSTVSHGKLPTKVTHRTNFAQYIKNQRKVKDAKSTEILNKQNYVKMTTSDCAKLAVPQKRGRRSKTLCEPVVSMGNDNDTAVLKKSKTSRGRRQSQEKSVNQKRKDNQTIIKESEKKTESQKSLGEPSSCDPDIIIEKENKLSENMFNKTAPAKINRRRKTLGDPSVLIQLTDVKITMEEALGKPSTSNTRNDKNASHECKKASCKQTEKEIGNDCLTNTAYTPKKYIPKILSIKRPHDTSPTELTIPTNNIAAKCPGKIHKRRKTVHSTLNIDSDMPQFETINLTLFGKSESNDCSTQKHSDGLDISLNSVSSLSENKPAKLRNRRKTVSHEIVKETTSKLACKVRKKRSKSIDIAEFYTKRITRQTSQEFGIECTALSKLCGASTSRQSRSKARSNPNELKKQSSHSDSDTDVSNGSCNSVSSIEKKSKSSTPHRDTNVSPKLIPINPVENNLEDPRLKKYQMSKKNVHEFASPASPDSTVLKNVISEFIKDEPNNNAYPNCTWSLETPTINQKFIGNNVLWNLKIVDLSPSKKVYRKARVVSEEVELETTVKLETVNIAELKHKASCSEITALSANISQVSVCSDSRTARQNSIAIETIDLCEEEEDAQTPWISSINNIMKDVLNHNEDSLNKEVANVSPPPLGLRSMNSNTNLVEIDMKKETLTNTNSSEVQNHSTKTEQTETKDSEAQVAPKNTTLLLDIRNMLSHPYNNGTALQNTVQSNVPNVPAERYENISPPLQECSKNLNKGLINKDNRKTLNNGSKSESSNSQISDCGHKSDQVQRKSMGAQGMTSLGIEKKTTHPYDNSSVLQNNIQNNITASSYESFFRQFFYYIWFYITSNDKILLQLRYYEEHRVPRAVFINEWNELRQLLDRKIGNFSAGLAAYLSTSVIPEFNSKLLFAYCHRRYTCFGINLPFPVLVKCVYLAVKKIQDSYVNLNGFMKEFCDNVQREYMEYQQIQQSRQVNLNGNTSQNLNPTMPTAAVNGGNRTLVQTGIPSNDHTSNATSVSSQSAQSDADSNIQNGPSQPQRCASFTIAQIVSFYDQIEVYHKILDKNSSLTQVNYFESVRKASQVLEKMKQNFLKELYIVSRSTAALTINETRQPHQSTSGYQSQNQFSVKPNGDHALQTLCNFVNSSSAARNVNASKIPPITNQQFISVIKSNINILKTAVSPNQLSANQKSNINQGFNNTTQLSSNLHRNSTSQDNYKIHLPLTKSREENRTSSSTSTTATPTLPESDTLVSQPSSSSIDLNQSHVTDTAQTNLEIPNKDKTETVEDEIIDVEKYFLENMNSDNCCATDYYLNGIKLENEPIETKPEVQKEVAEPSQSTEAPKGSTTQHQFVIEHPEALDRERYCICSKKAELICPCGNAIYCSPNCQATDWINHSSWCISNT